jgi:hypothetical protein
MKTDRERWNATQSCRRPGFCVDWNDFIFLKSSKGSVRMKSLLTLLAIAFANTAIAPTVSLAQDTPANTAIKPPKDLRKPLVNDLDTDSEIGDWKQAFENRLIDNQQYSKQLASTKEMSSIDEFRKTVKEVADQLAIESHLRKQLEKIATTVGEESSSTNEKEDSQDGDVISLDEAKSQIAKIAAMFAFKPTFETDLPANFAIPTPVGEIEIKRYMAYRLARTPSKDGSGFFRLFNHIKKENIEMTSPVQMTYENSDGKYAESDMAFLYPDQQTGELKQSNQVNVVDAKPTSVISMGMRGRPTTEEVAKAAKKLRQASLHYLTKFRLSDEVRLLGYNGPSVPAADQFYEVQIELLTKKDKLERKVQ